MANTAPTRSPFDLPELRHLISRFVTVKDALSCALVSSSWADNFLSAIWFKIDFDAHPKFADVSPDIIAKHGHFIKVVRNAKTADQVESLDNAGVNSLREIRIEAGLSDIVHAHAYEIVSRNNTTLEYIYLFANSSIARYLKSMSQLVNVQALVPSSLGRAGARSSPLKILRLKRLYLTHHDLVEILKACPKLYELRLADTDIVGTPTQLFQHEYLKILGSNLTSLFTTPSNGLSLLSYFPRLTTLSTFYYGRSSSEPSATVIKDTISRYCPQLTGYYLEDQARIIVSNFLANIASNVTHVCFLYDHLTQDMLMTILLHRTTLTAIRHFNQQTNFDLEKDELVVVTDHFKESREFLQRVPRLCPALKDFDLPGHEMDMDVVESGEWVCKDLKTLRVRIKDLDTKDKILKAIALWRKGCWERWQKQAGAPEEAVDEQEEIETSIEARVARHLLKFDKLWRVWLGYQTWNPI